MIHPRNRQLAAGTAMMEMVMAVPFLASVVAFIFFFGWAMLHKQQVIMASRYVAWESIYNAPPSEDRVNQVAMSGKGINIVVVPANATATTQQDLLNRIGDQGARSLAEATIGSAFPGGTDVRTTADFTARWAAWAQFSPTISSHHSRDGVTWNVSDVTCWNALSTLYLSELDQSLENADPAASGMTSLIRNLYLGYWGPPTQ